MVKDSKGNKRKEMELSNLCGHFGTAQLQKRNNMNEELRIDRVFRFEDVGCYECNGFDNNCPHYFSPVSEYNRFVDGIAVSGEETLRNCEHVIGLDE